MQNKRKSIKLHTFNNNFSNAIITMQGFSLQGFSLIELVIVIVIIGILAVAAIPQYINLAASAQNAATESVAGSLSSASVINYGNRSLNPTSGIAITNCNQIGVLLQGGALPSGYSINTAAIAAGASATCTLVGPKGTSANFTAYGIA